MSSKEDSSLKTKYEIELENSYSPKEVGIYVIQIKQNIISNVLKEIEENLTSNNIISFNKNLEKIEKMRLFKLFSEEEKISLMEKIIQILSIYHLNQFYTTKIIHFIGIHIDLIPQEQKVIFPWKLFYKIYLMNNLCFKGDFFSDFKIFKVYKNLFKFISISEEDYSFLKKEVLQGLYHINLERKYIYLNVIKFFFPKKLLLEDEETQKILFNIMKNSMHPFKGVCSIFRILLSKNGKIKLENLNEFIEIFFSRLNQKINGSTFINTYRSLIKRNKKHKNTDNDAEQILVYLLFNDQFKNLRNIIDEHFKILISSIHMCLKERYNEENGKIKVMNFMENLSKSLKSIFTIKNYDSNLNKMIYSPMKNNINEELIERFSQVYSYLYVIIKKFLLFDIKGSGFILSNFFEILSISNKIKFNINEYLSILEFYQENTETQLFKFVKKLNNMFPLLINPNYYFENQKIKSYINNIIPFLIDCISSAAPKTNNEILKIFSKFYLYTNDKKYENLNPLLEEASIKIMQKIVKLFDLFTQNSNILFTFTSAMFSYIKEENKNKISDIFTNHLMVNEIPSSRIKNYFEFDLFNDEDNKRLFNFVYDSLIYMDTSNNLEINEHFLIQNNNSQKLKMIEVQVINKEKLKVYEEILSNIDFNNLKIYENEKMKNRVCNIINGLLNKKEKIYYEIPKVVLNKLFSSLIEPEKDEKTKCNNYNNEKKLDILLELITNIIEPYEKYSMNIIQNYKEDIKYNDRIFDIYIILLSSVLTNYKNIFINFNDESFDDYPILKNQLKQINLYFNKQYMNMKTILNLLITIFQENKQSLFTNSKSEELFYDIFSSHLKTFNSFRKENPKSLVKIQEVINSLKPFYHLTSYKSLYTKLKKNDDNKQINLLINSKLKNFDLYYNDIYAIFHTLNNKYLLSSRGDFNELNIYDNYPKEKIFKLYDDVINYYIKKISDLKTGESSEINQIMMEIISENSFFIYNSFIQLSSDIFIKMTIDLFQIKKILKEKGYYKINQLDFDLIKNVQQKIQCVILGHNKLIKNKLSKYPSLESMTFETKINVKDENIINGLKNYLFQTLISLDKEKEIDSIIFFLVVFIPLFYKIFESNDTKMIEKIILQNINDKNISIEQKQCLLLILFQILKFKYNSDKKFTFTNLSKEEYGKEYKNIIKAHKTNLNLNSIYYENIPKSSFNIGKEEKINIIDLINSFNNINDWISDKKLMEGSKPQNIMKFFKKESMNEKNIRDIFSMLLMFLRTDNKGFRKNVSGALNVLHVKLITLLLLNGYIDEKEISIEKFKENNDLNNDIQILTFIEFICGKFNYQLKSNLFIDNKEIWNVLDLYSNGKNMKIDSFIEGLYDFLIQKMNINQAEILLKNYDLNKCHLSFILKIYTTLSNKFDNNLKYFDNQILPKENVHSIINLILDSNENIIKYKSNINSLLSLYLKLDGSFGFNENTFENNYSFNNETITKVLKEINDKGMKKEDNSLKLFFFDIFDNFYKQIIGNKEVFANYLTCISHTFKECKVNSEILKNYESCFKRTTNNINISNCINLLLDDIKADTTINEKLIYLQAIRLIFSYNIHYFNENNDKEKILNGLISIIKLIKNEELKEQFSEIFVYYFNILSDEENNKFIQDNKDKDNEFLFVLLSQLLRFRIDLPKYIQEYIASLKNKRDNKVVKNFITNAMDRYHNGYLYMKTKLSPECKEILEDTSRNKNYFS